MSGVDRALSEQFFVSTNGGNVHSCAAFLNTDRMRPFGDYVLCITAPGIIVWRAPRPIADQLIHELGQTPLDQRL